MIKSWAARLKASNLLRNVLLVGSGTALAQLITLAFSPVITRIYSPEVFGLQGVFLSLVGVFSPVIALRYPMSIITAKSDAEAMNLGRLSILIALLLAFLFEWVLLFAREPILKLLGAEALGHFIFVLPLALIFIALQDVADYKAARLSKFKLVGKVEALIALIANTARVLGGLMMPVAAVLVSVTTVVPAIKAALLSVNSGRVRDVKAKTSISEVRALASRYSDFPIYRMPTDVVNAVSQSIPVILLASLFGPTAAGFYALSRTAINLPVNVIQAALGNVIYARFGQLEREGRPLFKLAARSTLLLLLVPGSILLVFAIFAPSIFAFVFGDEWRTSGIYAQWMCLWIVLLLANIPSVRSLPVIQRQNWHLIMNSLILAGGAVGLYVGYRFGGNAVSAVALYSVIVSNLYLLQIVIYLFFIWKFDQRSKQT